MADGGRRHTIVLVQFDETRESRSYLDYDSVPDALDGICQLYEQSLKVRYPNKDSVTYDVEDLFSFVESVGDLCCFVFSEGTSAYVPHNKNWIKRQVFDHLKSQVQ